MLTDRVWRCMQGHSFDVAKQGYVNLLPVQKKRSKDPGDSKAMVEARAQFLAGGYYQPFAHALAHWASTVEIGTVLDAGCGEGYYLREFVAAAGKSNSSAQLEVAGLDISKWAVLAAAKHAKQCASFRSVPATWLVASNSHIPLAEHSINTVLCLFGFPVSNEFKRVLAATGRVVMLDPAAQHLQELKQIIYPNVHEKEYQLPLPTAEWQLEHEQRVTFQFTLPNPQAIHNLLVMTPHLYRASAEGRARAESLHTLTLTADAWLRVFTPT